MINPFCFIDEDIKLGLKINLESQNINHAISILFIIPMYPDFGIEKR